MASLFIQYVDVSVIWDTENLLGYKDSPTDLGKEIFLRLYKNRTRIDENELIF